VNGESPKKVRRGERRGGVNAIKRAAPERATVMEALKKGQRRETPIPTQNRDNAMGLVIQLSSPPARRG